MSVNHTTRMRLLRWLVFNIWFFSLLVVLLSFSATAILYGPLDPGQLIKSATLLFGMILPPLGTILIFFGRMDSIHRGRKKIDQVGPEMFAATLMCSVTYHMMFALLVIAGVVKLWPVGAIGPDALYQNCVFIVNWMGMLSVLLGPSLWLFTDSQRPAEGGGAVTNG